MVGRMGIVLRIAVRVVHPVQYGVGSWTEVRRPLRHPGKDVEDLFPERTHIEHLMR